MERITQLPALPRRPADSNKGHFGRVLVAAGSRGMAGAAVLCGSAALRAGAGLVRVAVPAEIGPIVAMGNPCYTTAYLPADADGRFASAALTELLNLADGNDVLALGPGLGRSPELDHLVRELIANVSQPIVLDADGLNALADQPGLLGNHAGPLIVTPHPGEFSRLAKIATAHVQAQRETLAVQLAKDHGLIVVLKGHETVVTDGRRVYVNHTGNPGMATGGTGDVLTGTMAALLAQKLEPFSAAQLAVHVHGLAGDLVRDNQGEVGMTAGDLVDYLPRALRSS